MSDPHSPIFVPTTVLSLVRTALPIGAFYVTEILVGLTDLAVVGALGTTELAAVGLGKTILLSVMVVGFAVLSIGAVLMAERPTLRRCGTVVAASAMVAVPFALVAVLVGRGTGDLLASSGYDADLVAGFDAYASVLAWVIGPALVFAALKNVLNAVGRTGAIAWLSIGIVLGNLVGSIFLVHGVGDWAGLGVAGAAWATSIVNGVAATLLFAHALRAGFMRLSGVRLREAVKAAAEIVRLGWAAGAQQALESVLFIVVLYLLGLYSALWLAAGAVVFAVMELNCAMSGALGEVLSARLASARVTGRENLRRLLGLGGAVSGGAAAILAMTVGLFAEAVVGTFSSTQTSSESRKLMVELLRWTAPFFLFDAWQITFVHALRGLRRTVLPMVLSMGCYWIVGLGGGTALAGPAGFGAPGVWIGFCAGLACAATLLAAMAFTSVRALDQGA
jgi:MATE family multidrug resistance protein